MSIVFHEYDVPGFRAYLEGYKRRGAVLKASFLHHTWSPTVARWRGLQSMEGIRRAHRARGFSDIACHAYATPQGTIFNARPPSVNNCACQYPDEAANTWPPELRQLSGGSKSWMNQYGFGIETVGNFDAEDPATSIAMRTSLDVLAIVHELWAIPVEHCFFHRDVSGKTCPGTRVHRDWVHAELRRRLTMPDPNRPDVADWAKPYVERVQDLGLMTGYPDGSFGGAQAVTREELAVIVCRLLDLKED
jgi:hypothetical protein